jgi:hypothetical protein
MKNFGRIKENNRYLFDYISFWLNRYSIDNKNNGFTEEEILYHLELTLTLSKIIRIDAFATFKIVVNCLEHTNLKSFKEIKKYSESLSYEYCRNEKEYFVRRNGIKFNLLFVKKKRDILNLFCDIFVKSLTDSPKYWNYNSEKYRTFSFVANDLFNKFIS